MGSRKTRKPESETEMEILRRRVAELEAKADRAEQAERALTESRERYRLLMENAGDAILIAQADSGLFVDCNRKAEELLGRPRDEIIGLHQTELHPPDTRDHFREQFENAVRRGHPARTTGRVQHTDGSVRQVEITTSIHDLNGKRLVQGILRDVTDARAAQAALRDSEEKYRTLVEQSSEGILLIKGVILDCNAAASRSFGGPREELIGHTPAEFSPPQQPNGRDSFEWQHELWDKAYAGEPQHFTWRMYRKDGSLSDLDVTLKAIELSGEPHLLAIGRDVTRQREMVFALAESQRMLQLVLDAIPVRVFWKDTDLRYLGCNHLFAQDAGLSSPEEIIGASDFDLGWRDQAERYRADDSTVIRSGVSRLHYEEPQTTPSGGTIWLRTSKIPLRNEAGTTIGVMGTYEDVTEQKDAEERLHHTQALLQAAIEASPAGVLVADAPDVNIRLANSAALAIRGDRAAPLTEIPYEVHPERWQCFYPDGSPYRGEDLPLSRAVLNGETVRNVEVLIRRTDGEDRWVLGNAAPVRDSGGRIVAGVVVFPDITERKRAEEGLKESQRALATLMGNLPGMAYRCKNDEHWTMVFVSDGCRGLTGYLPEDLINNRSASYADLIRADFREEVRKRVDEALAARRPFELSYPIRTATGEERWTWERGRGVFADDGSLLFLEGFIFDVTERHRAEEERDRLEAQLRQSQKMEAVGQLAGGVAHDFNNILTAIFGNIELAIRQLERQYPTAQNVLEGMREIERGAQRASALTRQLLAFSRRQLVRPEVLDLNNTLAELEKMLRRLITENIELHLRCRPELNLVKADPGQLEQLIVNLVVNARDAMPEGGQLIIETQNVVLEDGHVAGQPEARPGPHVMLAISDTGCGMGRATLERVFEPFFTTKPTGMGTGLGLSTVYGIVKQAGGHVVVYSEPDRGSTFKVYLPAVGEALARHKRAEAADRPPEGTETIVICEDDRAVRELTAHLLRDAGYTVLAAANAGDALQLAASHPGPIDLLVTDVVMPDMNGRKLADALLTLRPDVRTLYVSGYTSNVIAHHGVLEENVQFLEKPYSRRQLLQHVRTVLDRR